MFDLAQKIQGGIKEKLGGFREQRQMHKEAMERGKPEFIKRAKSKMAGRPFVNPHLATPEDLTARDARRREGGRGGFRTWDFFPEFYMPLGSYTHQIIGPMPHIGAAIQDPRHIQKLTKTGQWLDGLTMPELENLKQGRLAYWKNVEATSPYPSQRKEAKSFYSQINQRALIDYYTKYDKRGVRIPKGQPGVGMREKMGEHMAEHKASVKRGGEDVRRKIAELFKRIRS